MFSVCFWDQSFFFVFRFLLLSYSVLFKWKNTITIKRSNLITKQSKNVWMKKKFIRRMFVKSASWQKYSPFSKFHQDFLSRFCAKNFKLNCDLRKAQKPKILSYEKGVRKTLIKLTPWVKYFITNIATTLKLIERLQRNHTECVTVLD